ncbi:MAG: hypothetical protein JWP45_561 [Mucilaginibacter sp.]|nr:hypothetical protein [Mucilaginibacter sp.]MDB5138340.1 hypothetical protein [Mucilaginibacter sp.]
MQISYQHPHIIHMTNYKALIINANHFAGKWWVDNKLP